MSSRLRRFVESRTSASRQWLRSLPVGVVLGLGFVLNLLVRMILAAAGAGRWLESAVGVGILLGAVGLEVAKLRRRLLDSTVFRSGARAGLIIALLFVFAIIGFIEKAKSVPDDPSAIVNSEGRTTAIGVYVADAAADMTVELEVTRHGDPSQGPGVWAYDVFLTSSTSTHVLVVTTTPQLRDPLDNITPRFTAIPIGWGVQDFAAEYAVPARRRYNLGFFKVPDGEVHVSHGRIEAHLPMLTSDVLGVVDNEDNEVKPPAKYIAQDRSGRLQLLYGEGSPVSPQDVSAQMTSAGRPYYAAATFATKESFLSLGAVLPHYTVTFNSPSTGTPNQQDYVWTGTNGLSPYLYATDNSIIDGKSNAAFVSGIFFGAAAAALLALMQELKDDFWAKKQSRPFEVDAIKTSAILKSIRETTRR